MLIACTSCFRPRRIPNKAQKISASSKILVNPKDVKQPYSLFRFPLPDPVPSAYGNRKISPYIW